MTKPKTLRMTYLPTRIPSIILLLISCWSTITTITGFIVSPLSHHARTHSGTFTSNHRESTRTQKSKGNTKAVLYSEKVTRDIHSSVDLEGSWRDTHNEAPHLRALGDTQIIGSPDHPHIVHPVVKVLHDRKRRRRSENTAVSSSSTSNSETEPIALQTDTATQTSHNASDDHKIALVIEGGGMRGCVTAGMVCAIDYLGLRECVDVVYGSSAGSIIGAYFVTGQLPWFGPEVYYDQLTTAGKSFIDSSRLLRALGIGILNPKLLRDVITRRNAGKPVLDLDFLLQETMQRTKPLDWTIFEKQQQTKSQPLKIVASALKQEKPLVMEYGADYFHSIEELSMCMHASSLLPGIAGPVVNLLTKNVPNNSNKPKFVVRNNWKDDDYEPLADALVYAPIPYESAVSEGATHMIVLRSRPDGGDVIGKGGSVGEQLVWSRFFLRKNKLPNIYRRLRNQIHKKLYAKSVLELNEAAHSRENGLPPALTVAIPPEIEEIARLEVGREAIFEGVRNGFARAYDALVEDPSERGRGYEVAKIYFPDEILDYYPPEMLALQKEQQQQSSTATQPKSAFETYLEATGVWPKAWEGLDTPPLGYSSDRTTVTQSGRAKTEVAT